MDKRILMGCLAALGTMLGVDLLAQLSGWRLDLPVRTGLGIVPVGSIVTTLVAMAVGGWIARHRFRWTAVALNAAVWIATIGVLMALAPSTGAAATITLPGIAKLNALALVLSLGASWLGAVLGERLAARRRLPASA